MEKFTSILCLFVCLFDMEKFTSILCLFVVYGKIYEYSLFVLFVCYCSAEPGRTVRE